MNIRSNSPHITRIYLTDQAKAEVWLFSSRKQSKLIVDLISDDNRLSDERAKAKQIKERMAQVLGSGAHYGSYSSNTSPLPENKSN